MEYILHILLELGNRIYDLGQRPGSHACHKTLTAFGAYYKRLQLQILIGPGWPQHRDSLTPRSFLKLAPTLMACPCPLPVITTHS